MLHPLTPTKMESATNFYPFLDAVSILRAARDLLSDEMNHARYVSALGNHGCRVDADSPHARQWDCNGACTKVAGGWKNPHLGNAHNMLRVASHKLFHRSPDWVNDNFGHSHVLRMFDEAISLFEDQPNPVPAGGCPSE